MALWRLLKPPVNAEIDYRSEHLVNLFDRMAQTYGAVNLMSSFGFSHLWRKACVDALGVKPGHCCADLMTGMCESSVLLAHKPVAGLKIDAVDFCPAMTSKGREVVEKLNLAEISIQTADVLRLEGEGIYDRICVSFGIKTLNDAGQQKFAAVMHRLLKADGRAALVEIHVPTNALLRWPFLFYLRHVIPLIGRLLLGDPECYRSLAIYTEGFAERDRMAEHLERQGFSVTHRPLFFGCARLYVAEKGR